MLFSKIPNIEYDKKPLRFPFSETEYVLAKNFFRKFNINSTNLQSALYFNKYTMTDSDRPDILSDKFYGSTDFDWVILLTNGIVNPLFDLPMQEKDLYDFVLEKYEVPDGVHHYETLSVKNSLKEEILKSGLHVDAGFVSSTHKFYDRGSNSVLTKNGIDISIPVSYYEFEKKLNDQRREIYILKPEFLNSFVSQFEEALEYRKSKAYIDRTTKKSGV